MAYKAYLLALAIKMMALPKLPVLISQSGIPTKEESRTRKP